MITSNKQHQASKKQLAMLVKTFKAPIKKDVPDVIEKAGKTQLRDLISKIKAEIKEYDSLRNSKLSDIEIHSLEDLVLSPIRYRIATRMSIDTFSRKVGISSRQIARYEAERYSNINITTFRKILKEMDVNLDGNVLI